MTEQERCWECGVLSVSLHNHHPVPKLRGGQRTIPLCVSCHSKAHHRKGNMSTGALVKEGMQKKMLTGWRHPGPTEEVKRLALAARKKNANDFNDNIRKHCKTLEQEGYNTFAAQAARLCELGILSRRGKPLTMHNLHRIVRRSNDLPVRMSGKEQLAALKAHPSWDAFMEINNKALAKKTK